MRAPPLTTCMRPTAEIVLFKIKASTRHSHSKFSDSLTTYSKNHLSTNKGAAVPTCSKWQRFQSYSWLCPCTRRWQCLCIKPWRFQFSIICRTSLLTSHNRPANHATNRSRDSLDYLPANTWHRPTNKCSSSWDNRGVSISQWIVIIGRGARSL